MTGLLNFGDPTYVDGPEGNLMDPVGNLKRLNMPYRILTPAEIMAEFPFKDLPDNFVGVWAADNGCINVPLVLRTLYRLALSAGAKLVQNCEVIDMKVNENSVEVKVANGSSFKA
jgi:sarcosine oxidase / L-pipecolate oxidase